MNLLSDRSHRKLVSSFRNGVLDCEYYGSAIAVDSTGRLVAYAGNSSAYVFLRSTAKPFQVMALLSCNGVEQLQLQSEELAIMSGSHNGEAAHMEVINRMMRRFGISTRALICGIHAPLAEIAAIETSSVGGMLVSRAQNNCSGTHICLILLSRLLEAEETIYWEETHPSQIRVKRVLEEYMQASSEMNWALDSCGIPTFGTSLYSLALGYARLANVEDYKCYGHEAGLVRDSMRKHPFMVAGTNRLETQLMETIPVVAKIGAGGVYCLGVLEEGLGIAVKIESGSVEAAKIAAVELLCRLGVLGDEHTSHILRFRRKREYSQDGRVTGMSTAVFNPRFE